MDPLTIGAILGGSVGLLKGIGNRRDQRREAMLQAETTKWSPWTRMIGKAPTERDGPIGGAFGGAAAGAAFGKQFRDAPAPAEFIDVPQDKLSNPLDQPLPDFAEERFSPGGTSYDANSEFSLNGPRRMGLVDYRLRR